MITALVLTLALLAVVAAWGAASEGRLGRGLYWLLAHAEALLILACVSAFLLAWMRVW